MAGTTEGLTPLSSEELRTTDAYWRACNYLSAGMIYLRANPLPSRAAEAGAYQESAPWSLGLRSRPIFRLGSHEPSHQEIRVKCYVHLGPCVPHPELQHAAASGRAEPRAREL